MTTGEREIMAELNRDAMRSGDNRSEPDADDQNSIGTVWESTTGNRWRIVAHDGERICVERLPTHGPLRGGPEDNRYWWCADTLLLPHMTLIPDADEVLEARAACEAQDAENYRHHIEWWEREHAARVSEPKEIDWTDIPY